MLYSGTIGSIPLLSQDERWLVASAYIAFLVVSVNRMAWYCSDTLNQNDPIFGTNETISIHHDGIYYTKNLFLALSFSLLISGIHVLFLYI